MPRFHIVAREDWNDECFGGGVSVSCAFPPTKELVSFYRAKVPLGVMIIVLE